MSEYNKIVPKIAEIRGTILNEIILLERLIDEALSLYFCQDEVKRRDIMQLLLCTNRITFDSKKQILNYLMTHHYPEFLQKFPTLYKEIDEIIQERNRMAHYLLDTSGNWANNFYTNNSFNLVNFQVKIKQTESVSIPYDIKQVNDIIEKIQKNIKILIEFNEKPLRITTTNLS